MKKFIVLILVVFMGLGLNAQVLPAPEGLLCDLLREPSSAVITNKIPEFSWIFPRAGHKQAAYRILVASSPFLLSEGKADYWDSKRVEKYNSINIPFKGKDLNNNSTYWWGGKYTTSFPDHNSYSGFQ